MPDIGFEGGGYEKIIVVVVAALGVLGEDGLARWCVCSVVCDAQQVCDGSRQRPMAPYVRWCLLIHPSDDREYGGFELTITVVVAVVS